MRFPYLLASMLTISSFSSAMHDVAPYLEFVRPSAAADGRRFARAILSSKLVTFSVEWKALFDGAMVGKIDLYTPVVNFVQGPSRHSPGRSGQALVACLSRSCSPLISIASRSTTAQSIIETFTVGRRSI